jgi:hypothetical protein
VDNEYSRFSVRRKVAPLEIEENKGFEEDKFCVAVVLPKRSWKHGARRIRWRINKSVRQYRFCGVDLKFFGQVTSGTRTFLCFIASLFGKSCPFSLPVLVYTFFPSEVICLAVLNTATSECLSAVEIFRMRLSSCLL